ncbi:hypothetical protein [Arthrobacter sp.]|uniref:hypothetical protein n=1 Tax=Arthrobacter sp. TaxID=1667 RepID=UPI0026DFBB13|nr:hypothetical protein [Arthrobacter sp.]MDO5752460.1 hypothetical protein [Arthrobacter sp.]
MLEALYSEVQGQTKEANRLRTVQAEKAHLDFKKLEERSETYPWVSPDEYTIKIHRLVYEHEGDLKATVADPRYREAILELVQREDIGVFDEEGHPTVSMAEILSFVHTRVSIEAEALAQERAASVARGAVKAADLGKEMHFGVEGHSKADNARRLENAQTVHADLVRDGLDEQIPPFPLLSVIKHAGNLSEVVYDPALPQDLLNSVELLFAVVVEGVGEQPLNSLEQGTNQDYFDSVVASLKLKEQYGTDKSFQKAMQAASFASTQQQFPAAHAAAGKGKTDTRARSNAPVQHQRQQPGLAR